MDKNPSEKPKKPPVTWEQAVAGIGYLDRNMHQRPYLKAPFEEMAEQIQKSAGNMGDLSPVMPRSWIGREPRKEPLILRYLPREKETAEKEIPPANPRA
jgi:hypothetical protein